MDLWTASYFDGCSAPLCPGDEGIADRTWFPDEDVCRLSDVPGWVKRQRKVSRKAAPGGYFTLAMFRHGCRIARGMKGIDPDGTDKERAVDEAAWFKAHPVITEEEREKMRITAIEKGGLITVIGHKKSASEQGLDGVPGKKGIQVPLSPGYPLETR